MSPTPPSGYKSSEFHLTAIVAAVVQPILAYVLATKGNNVGVYLSMIASALCAVVYTISRAHIKNAWLDKTLEIISEVGKEIEEVVPATPTTAAVPAPSPLPPPPSEEEAAKQVTK